MSIGKGSAGNETCMNQDCNEEENWARYDWGKQVKFKLAFSNIGVKSVFFSLTFSVQLSVFTSKAVAGAIQLGLARGR